MLAVIVEGLPAFPRVGAYHVGVCSRREAGRCGLPSRLLPDDGLPIFSRPRVQGAAVTGGIYPSSSFPGDDEA
jgi:hypothetical protein